MDEFKVHLLSTASVEIFGDNTMAAFKNQLPQNISLDGDWRVALSEIIFPSEIKNVYTDFFYYVHTTKKDENEENDDKKDKKNIKTDEEKENNHKPVVPY